MPIVIHCCCCRVPLWTKPRSRNTSQGPEASIGYIPGKQPFHVLKNPDFQPSVGITAAEPFSAWETGVPPWSERLLNWVGSTRAAQSPSLGVFPQIGLWSLILVTSSASTDTAELALVECRNCWSLRQWKLYSCQSPWFYTRLWLVFLLLGMGDRPADIGAADVSVFCLMLLFNLHF